MTKIVVLSGAGISAESGLKTFRDSDGLWEGYDVYEVATPRGFNKNPQLVLDFYNMRRKDVAAAVPNNAHIGLAELEKYFDVQIITQNIDDLHERAGSKNVLHLHGEIFKMRSVLDITHSSIFDIITDIKLGDLAQDGAQLRPHIVWFEEDVPMLQNAIELVEQANIFIIIGTSLQVYPAAGLVNYVPKNATKYIIDKNIPSIPSSLNIFPIEAIASEGVEKLKKLLLELTLNKE
jgi:NAD-dependent deacetylase